MSMAAGGSILEASQDKNEYDKFISATHAERTKEILKEMLAKFWKISEDEVRRTLKVTSQLNHQDPDSCLSRKFGTNNCMLQYKRIDTHFFSDTL